MPLDGNESLYVTTDPDKEVRERAARVLEQIGWRNRPGLDAYGPICLLQAIAIAGGFDPVLYAQYVSFLTPIVKSMGFANCIDAAHWNDGAARTFDEVLALLRGAARG